MLALQVFLTNNLLLFLYKNNSKSYYSCILCYRKFKILRKAHCESLLWYFQDLMQTHDYGTWPEVLGGCSFWLTCWYS